MILYFSGTGNSRMTAKQIAETIGDEYRCVNGCLKNGKTDTFHSKRPFVFVVPTYAWRMPRVVERWIRESRFEGSDSAYFVLTCGGGCGNAAAYAGKICREKGMRFRGLAPVVLPDNYVALYAPPDENECLAMIAKAKPRISELAALIQNGKAFPENPVTVKSRLLSGPVNSIFYRFMVHDKGFTVTDGCVSCGKCAKRCPLENIELIDGKPVWNGNCTHCMACIGGCPVKAIEYKKATKGRNRYYIMEE